MSNWEGALKVSRRDAVIFSGFALASGVLGAQERTDSSSRRWHERVRRYAYHILNEYDPRILDVDEWLTYWKSLKIDALGINAGGLLAYYPTKILHHPKSQFLSSRDLFGEYFARCKENNIRVVARIETNWAHKNVFKARPDWFERDAYGNPIPHAETPWIDRICMYSSYYEEMISAIIRELSSLYDVDGFFTNSWPPMNAVAPCHCKACEGFQNATDAALYVRQEERVAEVCRLLSMVAKQQKSDAVYLVHIGSAISAQLNMKKLSEVGEWFTADHKSRSGTEPIWDCAQQGRAAHAALNGRPGVIAVGSNAGSFRHTAKSEAETTMWLAQTTATGMTPRYTWLGSDPKDERWRSAGREFFQWFAKNDEHLVTRRPITNLGLVWSQRMNAFYRAPGPTRHGYGSRMTGVSESTGDPTDYFQGAYYALLEGRFPFELVHEENLQREKLSQYSALILPNVALLSNAQIRELRRYVAAGGSLLATFETGLFDEWGKPRSNFGLADVFGLTRAGERTSALFYGSVERRHEIFKGFEGTSLLPGGEHRIPIESELPKVSTVVPPYPRGIPDMVYPYARQEMDHPGPQSNEPAVVVREQGQSRLVYFPGDIDGVAWRYGNQDASMLLQNAVRWILRDELPVRVRGEGVVEIFAWETTVGYSLHLLNYTNPHMRFTEIRRFYPVGPQHVQLTVPSDSKISRVTLLREETDLEYKQRGRIIEFVVPRIEGYEVAALHRA